MPKADTNSVQQQILTQDQKQLELITQPESPNKDDGDPENIFKRIQDEQKTDGTTAAVTEEQAAPSKDTGSQPSGDKKDPWLWGKIGLGFAVLLGLAGAGLKKGGYTFSSLFE